MLPPYSRLAVASLRLLVAATFLVGGCRSYDPGVPPPAAPVQGPANTAARESYLSPDAVARCVDLFTQPYRSGDVVLRFPPASNDLERTINRQIRDTNSAAITSAAKADDASAEKDSLWEFKRALGPKFTPANCSAIDAFITVSFWDAKRVNTTIKKQFMRPRPGEADPEHPKMNPSFPSGHSTTAGLRYRLLTAITDATPDAEVELFKQAWFMCFERLAVNVHYASDVAAGFVLGEMVADEVLKEAATNPNGNAAKALAAAREQWKAIKAE